MNGDTAEPGEDGEAARSVARRFLDAVLWGEHLVVWGLFSPVGREHVLQAGERRGLDPMQAERIRLGTSPAEERDAFLSGLVHGLRVDFASVPLQEVRPVSTVVARDDGSVEVPLECPAGFGPVGWAAGSLVVTHHREGWLIDRVEPVVSGGG